MRSSSSKSASCSGSRSNLSEPMMTYRTDTFRVSMAGPADLTGLVSLIDSGALDASHIVAILAKTEGNGGVNDFTREYTCPTIAQTLAKHLRLTPEQAEQPIAILVSGRTQRIFNPHAPL